MSQEHEVVEGIERHLALYLEATRKLTAILDQENQLLLFESGETQVLQDTARQEAKQALYARVETLARIVARTLQAAGREEDSAAIQEASAPVETFRRSLRLNSVLLEVCIERQERRMRRILHVMNPAEAPSESLSPEVSHVADRST